MVGYYEDQLAVLVLSRQVLLTFGPTSLPVARHTKKEKTHVVI